MEATSQMGIVLGIIIVFLVGGAILVLLQSRRIFSGYEEIASDARQLRGLLKGELFRDGGDLVVSGNYNRLPTVVRFSYSEYTSGLSINMKAPSTFSLSVAPKGERTTEGRVLVRSNDEMFDARFISRSDHPTQAKMFLGGKAAMAGLQKLMCSNKTFFTVSTGEIELSELVIPSNAGRHISEHIKQMGQMVDALRQMPGAEAIKIHALKREGQLLARLAIVALVVAGVVTIAATMRPSQPEAAEPEEAKLPAGVLPVDAITMARLPGFHLAGGRDLPPEAAAWLEERRLPSSGRLPGDYSGNENRRDVVYLLVAPNGEKRIVLLANGENKYDATFPRIDVIARVPWAKFKNVQWVGQNAPKPPDGDAVLVIRDLDDHSSGVVLYISDKQLASAVPVDFQNVPLQ